MSTPLPTKPQKSENIIFAVFDEDVADMVAALKPAHAGFLESRGFTAKAGSLVVVPSGSGSNEKGMSAWFGLGPRKTYSPLVFRALPTQLPRGKWRLKIDHELDLAAIHVAWGLGSYSFGRYKSSSKTVEAVLEDTELTPSERSEVALAVQAHDRVRDLVNTPANDMGPAQIESVARGIAKAHGAEIGVISAELLAKSYPAVHAVGRAAGPDQQPRFIEIAWQPNSGQPQEGRGPLPVICLVGKGVAFDTGGLNIKTGNGMGLMKKDMGGAAHALALAEWVMASQLPVKLHVLIPAVENAISGNAMRPGDVLSTRAGLTIEVGNTDAEGRLILADALTRASELDPALTIDFATLTGAARVALGPDIIPFYSDDEEVVRQLEIASIAQFDPLWRMPMWSGYNDALDSDIADIKNDPSSWAQAGSVTAALFLKRFAPKSGAWVHFDIYAWNPRGRAGAPVGGEAQTLRAVYQLLKAY